MVLPEVLQPDINSLTYAQIIDLAQAGDITCDALSGFLMHPAITNLHPQIVAKARRRIIALHVCYSHADKKVNPHQLTRL